MTIFIKKFNDQKTKRQFIVLKPRENVTIFVLKFTEPKTIKM